MMPLLIEAALRATGLALLAWLASASVARWYWLNPYVLLVGLWTFDGLMVAFLLGGLVATLRHRWLLAGVLLGMGAAVKFVPVLLVPVALLWALRTAPRPVSALVAVGAGFVGSLAVLVAPWWDHVLYVLQFQA